MRSFTLVSLVFVIIGALNWLLIGLFNWDLVQWLFGGNEIVPRIIYIAIGLAGLYALTILKRITR
ncbi:DUF378 domain-containing protein [Rubeoparvulum massiliense]|uniref:DUF378 domain-containing protein n=1 Tax=Rubeoparvulum massiliense TaxID=1631346 RepID=UPI00065E63FE|nr:DUF378 domain-containing protein [Rubeoparvulum massiliense]